MSSKNIMPTMTPDGWVDEPLKVANQMLMDYFTSLYSQSNTFRGNVYSFSYLSYLYNNDAAKMAAELKTDLSKYFSTMFDSVIVDTNVIASEAVTQKITVAIQFQDTTGTSYDIQRLFDMSGMSINSVTDIHSPI
jgi:hypothetical protein